LSERWAGSTWDGNPPRCSGSALEDSSQLRRPDAIARSSAKWRCWSWIAASRRFLKRVAAAVAASQFPRSWLVLLCKAPGAAGKPHPTEWCTNLVKMLGARRSLRILQRQTGVRRGWPGTCSECGERPHRQEGRPMAAASPTVRRNDRRSSRSELQSPYRAAPPRRRNRAVDGARPARRVGPARVPRTPAGLGDPVGPRCAGGLPRVRARRGYRQVYRILMAPGVSTEQASEAVLLLFERPASVLNRPRTDPGVQRAVRRRRSDAADALQVYRAASGR
jgi:hypothetical protein